MSYNPDRGRGRGRGRGQPGGAGAGRGSPRGGSPARGSPRGGSPAPGGGPGYQGGQGAASGSRGGTPPPHRGGPPRGGGGGPPRGSFGPRGGGAGRGGGPPQIFNEGVTPTLPDRLSPRNLDALIASFKKVPAQPEMPLRPGWGTKGKPITLRANFFPVTLPKNLTIYEYEIKYSEPSAPTAPAARGRGRGTGRGPNAPRKKEITGPVQGRTLQLLEQDQGFASYLMHIAHDRRTRLVSSKPLPEALAFDVVYYEEEETAPRADASVYHVEFKFGAELNTNELTQAMDGNVEYRQSTSEKLPLISALNLILQQHASRNGIRAGRNRYFFPSSNREHDLSLGLFARQGFFLSVRPTYKQLMVNINVCMTAFYYPGNLADAMSAFQRQSHGGMPPGFVDRLKVVTQHRGYPKKFTVKRIITRSSAKRTEFMDEEVGRMVTVEEFFKRKYKVTLKHADDLPVIDVSPIGQSKPTYLPAEICEIPLNQPYYGLLDPNATANMIKIACNPPGFNADAIVNQGIPSLGLQKNRLEGPLSGFGISVSNDMATVPARLLDSPRIAYRVGQPSVKDASWNILNVKFQSGGNMQRWGVLVVTEGRQGEFQGSGDPLLREFVETFAKKCRDSGMVVPQGLPTLMITPRLQPQHREQDPFRDQAMAQIKQTLTQNLHPQQKPSFVLVLLSGEDNFIYPGIKRLCDVQLGIHTVCMLLRKARGEPRKQDQYFSNVALKVNIKLGGINHTLDPPSMAWLKEKRTMMVGIDVTHPSPRSRKGTPSVVAVVASVDDQFVQFPASLGIQRNMNLDKNAEEMVQDLQFIMRERLLLYQARNKRLPERIMVFRDGVSEGQFDLVLRHELPQFLEAFKQFEQGSYKPTLSIVICGKRHHARNYATGQDHVSKNGNTLPGTVVDKGMTDVFNFDFYLQAHHGLQGTVRSTHYTVVYDENRLSADTIQEGANRLSYLYARATKGVSLIPPAYYADLACERARSYLNNFLNLENADDKSTVGSTKGRKKTKEEEQAEREKVFQDATKAWGQGIHASLRESMFYI